MRQLIGTQRHATPGDRRGAQHPGQYRPQPYPRRWLVGVSVLLGTACAGVLGIEDAECDVGFAPECSRVSGAAGGSGGNGGGGGTVAGNGGAGNGGAGNGGVGGSAIATGGNGASGGTSMAGSGPGPVASALCNQYCDLVMASCIDPYRQYASRNSCLAVCSSLEPGQPGVAGNTVECRLERAVLADDTGEPDRHCFSAGPGGAGECGADCEGYCTLMTATCSQLGSRAECLSACANVPDLSQSQKFNVAITSGDSIQCRLFHVSAARLDPVTHCEHAAGAAPCN